MFTFVSLSLCACEGSDIMHMVIASDSPETQDNDAVTKNQTIWWLIVIYFHNTDVIPQSQYIIFIVACQLSWM